MPRPPANVEGFTEAYLLFIICLGKKNAETIEFLGILKTFLCNNKKYVFLFTKKEMSCFIKKGIFIYLHNLQTFMTQSFTVLTTGIYLLLSYFSCSPILVFKTRDTERMLTLLYEYKCQKFNKMNEKRSLGYQHVGAEYVTGQINSLILQLLLRQFYHLIFAPSQKS